MSNSKLTVADDFPPVDYDTWRSTVEAELHGAAFERKLVSHTYEGIDIEPVYTRKDQLAGQDPTGFPGAAPFVRGSHPMGPVMCGVDLRQEHSHPDLKSTNKALIGDLEGGVTSFVLRLDKAASMGLPADHDLAGKDGVMIFQLDDLDAALEQVKLELIEVSLDAGAAFVPAAATLAALWDRRGVPKDQARASFNADPLATLARQGSFPMSVDAAMAQVTDLTKWSLENYPKVTSISIDTSPYHDAGATAAQDIAFAASTAVEYLRAMTEAGISVDDAVNQMLFRLSLGTHHFLAIAKLRAARQVWARIVESCGGKPHGMRIQARTSNRVMTHRDPYVNLLRNSVSMFAAMVGGVEIVTSLPFDHAAGLPNDFSRRIARNTVLILQEESHLHRVIDPAGGSWFLEDLTAKMADAAWTVFQNTEREGGMLVALQSGSIAAKIDAAYAPRARDIAVRKEGITGVSEFPNLTEDSVSHSPPDAGELRQTAKARLAEKTDSSQPLAKIEGADRMEQCVAAAKSGASLPDIATALGFHQSSTEIDAIEPRAFAQPFEELRDASDAWLASHGSRPRVFLANMGPVAHHTARAGYAKNFFEAGGFEVLSNNGFPDADAAAEAFKQSGANIAVICSSDKLYAEMVPMVAGALKAAGARTVVLAGNPSENKSAWSQAGVDKFIFIKCDVLATLRDLLREEEVLSS